MFNPWPFRCHAVQIEYAHIKLCFHVKIKLFVHGQVTIIFVVSVGLSVCLFVQSFSQTSDPISIKLGHMLYVWV